MMIFFYLLVAILPLSDHHILGKSYGGFTIFKALGAICLVHALVHAALKQNRPGFFKTWQARLSVLFLLITMIFFLLLPEHGDFSILWSCASFLAFFITAVSLVDSVKKLRRTLLWTIGSVAVASVYVIKQWWEFHNQYGADFRPGGATGDANYYAMSALLGLILAYYLAVEKRPLWERLFALASLCITLAGLSIAASRGGFLGMIVAFLYVVWRSRQRIRNLTISAALIVPFSVLLPSSPVNRFLHPSYGDRVGTESREIVWRAGWRMIQEHPILGIGVGRFKPQVERYELPDEEQIRGLAHNTYIEIAAEMGIPALVLFALILGFTFWSLESVRRMTLRSGRTLVGCSAIAIQASFLGYIICLFFLSGQYQKHLWFIIFLSIALRNLALPRARSKRSSSPAVDECPSLTGTGVWVSEQRPQEVQA